PPPPPPHPSPAAPPTPHVHHFQKRLYSDLISQAREVCLSVGGERISKLNELIRLQEEIGGKLAKIGLTGR
ncbi:MAG: hypothetical protein QW788_02910, partial [Candidatus Hadarchaeales archaeon]